MPRLRGSENASSISQFFQIEFIWLQHPFENNAPLLTSKARHLN